MREESRKEREPASLLEERKEANGRGGPFYIPENSIYDEQQPVAAQKRPFLGLQRTVTVFGYSPQNQEEVARRFKEHGEIKEISYGKNWMDIQYKVEKSMYKALRENGGIINGEMVGVVQKSRKETTHLAQYEKEQVLLKREEGVLGKIITYLFGQVSQ